MQTNSTFPDQTGAGLSRLGLIKCPLCSKSHDLENCVAFKRKSVVERRAFIAEKALCFACYGNNHVSKNCRKKQICKICKKPHPALLHIDGFSLTKETTKEEIESKPEENPVKVNNACTELSQNSDLVNDEVIILQTILPVLITNKNTNKTLKTYTFYDNGGRGCFLTENLRKRLAVPGTRTTLQLGTMHGQSLVESTAVKDLVITDLNGKCPIELLRAYTRDEIPADHDQIPTPEIVRRLDHLEEIANEIPAYDSSIDIGLLIGSNCPAALVSLSAVPNKGDGPYAVRLKHGWTVSGPLHVITESATKKVTVSRNAVREVENLT